MGKICEKCTKNRTCPFQNKDRIDCELFSANDLMMQLVLYKIMGLSDVQDTDSLIEADQYVRDHLLIQWMLYRVTRRDADEFKKYSIEKIYEEWTEWLKR